jgi:CubicO group peptidase (beta-lactamase class C family)
MPTKEMIKAIFSAWAQEDFSGVFHVCSAGQPILAATGGFRNIAEDLPNNLTTRFGIASGTKLFTATALCLLADRGLFTLEDRLLDILDLEPPKEWREITLLQLLTHTAGVPDYFDESQDDDYEALWQEKPVYSFTELAHFLPLFQHKSCQFTPGERLAYSNSGYILLGLVIEKVTGQRFREFVTRELLEASGLIRSGFYRMDMLPGNTALGYISAGEAWRSNIFSVPVVGGADGGLFTNAEDMVKFWQALTSGQILSITMLRRMLSPHCEYSESHKCGLGVYLPRANNYSSFHVVGRDPGAAFFSAYYPQTEIIATAFTNNDSDLFSLLGELNKILK